MCSLLSRREIENYKQDGFVIAKDGLRPDVIHQISTHLETMVPRAGSTVFEADGVTPRAMHGDHLDDALLAQLVRETRILAAVKKLLASDVYVYQFKINVKKAAVGRCWPWHDDYTFWHNDDGMPLPRAVTVGIFLDEVTELNGPVCFVPGSHNEYSLSADCSYSSWQSSVSEELKYTAPTHRVRALTDKFGTTLARGAAGAVLFFDCRILHSSGQNLSQNDRRIIFITYNDVDNPATKLGRPEFLVSRDVAPLEPGHQLTVQ